MIQKKFSRHRSTYHNNLDIPEKANRILNIILLAMALIVLRCWHLSVIQYENRLEKSQRPKERTILEPAKRATIRDRFNIPLAVNKVQYQAAVLYSQIREIPSIVWKKDPKTGKKERIYQRNDYIKSLANLLARELNLNSDRIVDLIHSKAALYGHIPYVIKEDITEKEYYRLKMLEKDWQGIHVRHYPKRYYPQGKVGASIVGYMGAINREEYEKIIQEIQTLENFLTAIEEGANPEPPANITSEFQAKKRLYDLKEKAYSINDHVGKSGIEGKFEEELRGFQGKKRYYSDARGNFLRELPGSQDPLSGQRLLLTISSELQEFAEELLIKNEQIRKPRLSSFAQTYIPREPWIKGGAIVAMDPDNGEVLALASYPRFDPNDFVSSGNLEEKKQKQSKITCWFETENYLGEIWDQKRPVTREIFDPKFGIVNDEKMLNWDEYLLSILPEGNPVFENFKRFSKIYDAVNVQRLMNHLLSTTQVTCAYHLFNTLYENDQKYGGKVGAVLNDKLMEKIEKNAFSVQETKAKLNQYLKHLPSNYDKVLYIDLCRLIVQADLFSNSLLNKFGNQSLTAYKNAAAALATLDDIVKAFSKELFQTIFFKKWRKEFEKEFLKEKRMIEKEKKSYAKPYLDYIDQKERELFDNFWGRYRWQFLTVLLTGKWMEYHPDEDISPYIQYFLLWHQELESGAHSALPWTHSYHHLKKILQKHEVETAIEYLQTLRSFKELERPLLGRYLHLKKEGPIQLEKHLATGFYPRYGYGYARSHAYCQATTLGSIFKLVTAYETLVQRYAKINNQNIALDNLNPLTIQDQFFKVNKDEFVGYHENGKPISRYYKGGRLPRSLSRNIGKVDILTALERSSNPYFALLAGDILNDQEDLANAAKNFSYGEKTGIDLPLEISGTVPNDLSENKTGLYSLAIGQHSLVVTPLQTAVMLSTIANGGKVFQPKIVNLAVGRLPSRSEEIIVPKPPFKYQEFYAGVGLNFPLFTEAVARSEKSVIQQFPTILKNRLFFPDQVRRLLIEGMSRVVNRSQQFAIGSLQHLYQKYPEAIKDLIALKGQLVGKTSTAEYVETIDLDLERGKNKYNHLWFGGISFKNDKENTFVFKDKLGKPELVVVVYLRYGAYGKDTMPIAAQMIQKWREIKEKRLQRD